MLLTQCYSRFHRDHFAPPEGSSRTRRKSIYNFFLGRQDAMDDHNTSPSVNKKQMKPTTTEMKPSETVFSLKSSETPTSPPQKSKRATSFIKKKPRLERGLSDQSVLRLNRNVHLGNLRFNSVPIISCLTFCSLNRRGECIFS